MVFYEETYFWIGTVILLGMGFIFLLGNVLAKRNIKPKKKNVKEKVIKVVHKVDKIAQPTIVKEELLRDNEIILKEDELKDTKFYAEVEPYDYLYNYKYKRKFFVLWKRRVKVAAKKRNKVFRKPEKFVKVRFKLLNDRVVEFPVIASLIGFVFNKGKYLFDEGAKYETIQGQELIPTYDFHEALVLPIKQRLTIVKELQNYLHEYDKRLRKAFNVDESLKKDARILQLLKNYEDMLKLPTKNRLPVDDIKDILESGNITETENIVNPHTLHRYLKSDFIQQLVKGALTKLVKIIFWVVIAMLLILVIDLIIDIVSTLQITGAFEKLAGATSGKE